MKKRTFGENLTRAGWLKVRLVELIGAEGKELYYNLLAGYGYKKFNDIRKVDKQEAVIADLIKIGKAVKGLATDYTDKTKEVINEKK